MLFLSYCRFISDDLRPPKKKNVGGFDWRKRKIIIPSDVRPAPFQNHTPAPHKQIYTTHMLLLSTILEIKVEERKKNMN